MSTKTVSAIIPVFNGQATIAEAIDSALAQDFDDLEVVVVNDGSTDETASVLEGYRGRITVLDRANGGPASARNAGVSASHGEYVAFLDADDIWMPSKLNETVTALDADSGAAMVYTNASLISDSGALLGATYTPEDERRAPSMEDMLARLWNILPSSTVMRRATFDAIGGFREEFATGHPQWEDSYFMVVAREQGRFIYLDEPTVKYRVAASVADNLKRRRVLNGAESKRVERYARNSELMQRLVRERYGERASGLIAAVRGATVNQLVGVGLTAMLDYDRIFARRCYQLALHYGPLEAKTYARLAWTYLPERVGRPISERLPTRIKRAVRGPANAGIMSESART